MKRHTDKTQTGETNIEFCWPKSFQCTNSTLTYVTGMNCLLGRILQRFFGRSLQQFFGRSLQQFFGRTLQHFSAELTRPNCSGISAELCNIFRPNFATFFGRNLSQFTRPNCSGKITWILESFRNLPGRTVSVFSSLFWFLQQIYIKISYNRPLNKQH